MRRFWSVLFVSVLILSMVAGCAVPTTPAPAAEAPAAAQPAVEAPAAAPEAAPTEAPMAEAPVEAAPMTGECVNDATGETIGVYQQAGLTGALSTILGPGFINGSKDAVADINSHGGVCGAMLEIHLEDTQYDPEQELAVYEKFRAETPKPMFILSYGSGAAIVLKDRTVEDQIVNITAGLNADAFYNPADGWTVGVAPIYSDQFAGFLQWAHDNWATIKPAGAGDDIVVGVVGWANSFGAGATTPEAIAYAEALGITVLPLEQQDISPSADVTGQLQNLLVGGANIIWSQALSFGPVQVIGTLRALGVWDQVVVGGVNWAMNQDVLTILGDNAGLASGFYGVFPYLYWNDTDAPGVQKALAAFEAGGHPAADKGVGYLLSYGSLYAVQTILTQAMNNVGYAGLDGMAFYDALKELGTVSAGGLFDLDVTNGNRAPQQSQIRQVQAVDGELQFVVVEDFFQLPDTRPGQ